MSMTTRDVITVLSEERYSKRLLKDWTEYTKLVSKAYIAAPSFDGSVRGAWDAMVPWIENMYKKIFSEEPDPSKKKVHVQFTEEDPYENAEQVHQDIAENNRLKVYTGGEPHPIWSQEINAKFRAIHDKMAHYDRPSDFTMSGEIKAYNAHTKTCPKISIPALFTEVVGQAAVFYTTGSFGEQKIAILPGFDYTNLGVVEGHEIQDKQLVRK